MGVLLACMSVYHVHVGTQIGQKRAADTLGLELQTVINHHAGAGNGHGLTVLLTADLSLLLA